MKKYLLILLFLLPATMMAQVSFKSMADSLSKKDPKMSASKFKKVDSTLFISKNIVLIARHTGDSVVLRWSCSSPVLWQQASTGGYVIERTEYDVTAKTKKKVLLTAQPLLPYTLEQWQAAYTKAHDTLFAVAAELQYGKSTSLGSKPSLQSLMDKTNDQGNRVSLASFLSDVYPSIAKGFALRYTDKHVDTNKIYLYRVYAVSNPKIYRSDTAFFAVDFKLPQPKNVMGNILSVSGDKVITLGWQRENPGEGFTAYFVERSNDGGKTFKKLNRLPFSQLLDEKDPESKYVVMYRDSVPRDYVNYTYRVTGVDAFGNLSPSSNLLTTHAVDKEAPVPAYGLKAINIKNKQVKITWMKKTREADFDGFLIGRSQNLDGPYIPLFLKTLPFTTNQYVDTSADPHGTNYYVVSAFDTAGNSSRSIPAYVVMIDTTPPSKPSGLKGTVDTNGIVTLKWDASKEPDVKGYLVYFSNSPSHVFTPITRDFFDGTSFLDSINLRTLSKRIYYKVRAFDRNNNPSKYSDMITVIRPDKVPPAPPVITTYFVTDTSVNFNWNISSSKDVKSQNIYRKTKGNDWSLVASIDKSQHSYTDLKVNKGTAYEYCLMSIDSSGLRSDKCFPLSVKLGNNNLLPAVASFKAVLSEDHKSIIMQWSAPSAGNIQLVIYKCGSDDKLYLFHSVDASTLKYVDLAVSSGNKYGYAVRLQGDDGKQSPITQTVFADIK